jgi:hypothetical protein
MSRKREGKKGRGQKGKAASAGQVAASAGTVQPAAKLKKTTKPAAVVQFHSKLFSLRG